MIWITLQLRFKSILKIDNKTEDKIISLVDKILQLKGRDVNSDTKEFEEEIKVVENGK